MISFRKLLFAAVAALGVSAVTAADASAAGNGSGCTGPFCNTPRYPTLGSFLFRNHGQPALPTYQAAPWYLYWPYDGHFQTPAPIAAPFHAPPVAGNFPVNPYFPAPAGPYGPIPGGPAPAGVPIAPGGFGPGAVPAPLPPAFPPQP